MLALYYVATAGETPGNPARFGHSLHPDTEAQTRPGGLQLPPVHFHSLIWVNHSITGDQSTANRAQTHRRQTREGCDNTRLHS